MSVEQLAHISEQGLLVRCLDCQIFEKPRKADIAMNLSVASLYRLIKKGLEYQTEGEEQAPVGGLLEKAKAAIRSTGLSYEEIAKRVGVSRQAVAKVMDAPSVQTRTLDKYLSALVIEI